MNRGGDAPGGAGPAFLFDLDGTSVDSVYQHVLAWREALEEAGRELAVWRIDKPRKTALSSHAEQPYRVPRYCPASRKNSFA